MVAALVPLVHDLAVELHPQAAHQRLTPLFLAHLGAVGPKPLDVVDMAAMHAAALEELAPVQRRVRVADLDEPTRKLQQRPTVVAEPPVDPADLVVLAVGVVVAALSAVAL